MQTTELVAISDIARLLGVERSAVWNWTRSDRRERLGFPEPVAHVHNGMTALYDKREILRWYEGRK